MNTQSFNEISLRAEKEIPFLRLRVSNVPKSLMWSVSIWLGSSGYTLENTSRVVCRTIGKTLICWLLSTTPMDTASLAKDLSLKYMATLFPDIREANLMDSGGRDFAISLT